MLTAVIGVVGLVIAFLAALHARQSAAAAEASAEAAARSAEAAESAVKLQASKLRDEWIDRLSEALPDPRQVGRLIRTLPETLAEDWHGLLIAAWRRNPRMAAGNLERLLHNLEEELDDESAH
jgi:type II secretory pathway pseudopilin PulG